MTGRESRLYSLKESGSKARTEKHLTTKNTGSHGEKQIKVKNKKRFTTEDTEKGKTREKTKPKVFTTGDTGQMRPCSTGVYPRRKMSREKSYSSCVSSIMDKEFYNERL